MNIGACPQVDLMLTYSDFPCLFAQASEEGSPPSVYQKMCSVDPEMLSLLGGQMPSVYFQWQTDHENIIQPVDLRLLSPAISAYSAARSVPVSRLRSTFQPVDQHLSAS